MIGDIFDFICILGSFVIGLSVIVLLLMTVPVIVMSNLADRRAKKEAELWEEFEKEINGLNR